MFHMLEENRALGLCGIPIYDHPNCFWPKEGCTYGFNYKQIAEDIYLGKIPYYPTLRELIKQDLWFVVAFIMKVPMKTCNHPHWVNSAYEVMDGPKTNTMDIWARGHAKSTIITQAETIQRICRDPEERICIMSYARSAALKLMRPIKQILETSEDLKGAFPDIFYQNPEKEAFKWSEETGLYVKRTSYAKEATLEAWGMIEGMPTGSHFSTLIYDDVVTQDVANSPEMMTKIKEGYDASLNLGTVDGTKRVIGTFYNHDDAYVYILNKKKVTGEPIYTLRKKPATVNGEYNGKSIYLPEEELAELRANDPYIYACQQLCDPTPLGERKLHDECLKFVSPLEIPKKLYKFMLVDPAGMDTNTKRRGDSWSLMVVGVVPYLSDIGASDLYILDMLVKPMNEADSMNAIVNMYCRWGRIVKLAVEKVGISTMEIHIANALKMKGKYVSLEAGNLHILRTEGRAKQKRIEANIAWPLLNGKIHVSTAIPEEYRNRLVNEMQKFPHWKDDALDTLSYSFDLMKEVPFSRISWQDAEEIDDYWESKYGREREFDITKDKWMVV